MDPSARHEPLLPSARAFVLQLYAGATVAHFRGRVEHIASEEATHFQTMAELLAFIARLVAEGRGQSAAEG